MFLANTDSFLLIIRRPIIEPGFSVFLPNADSFLLIIRRPIIEPSFTSETGNVVDVTHQSVESTDSEQSEVVNDQKKRNFLKVAGVAGAGIIASQLFSPKKASALIMGSSPTTGVVGVKNAANTRINPATEETVSSLLKPTDLTFDTGSLAVKVTSLPSGSSSFSDSADVAKSGLVDADRHVQVDVLTSALPATASTETTLQTISFGGTKFALRFATNSGDSNIEYLGEASVGTADSAASWRIKKVDSASGVIITWADGDELLNNVWNNRESLSYS